MRQNNQDLIAECDAVILFYGAADEGWRRSIGNELKKATAYRGAKPSLASTFTSPNGATGVERRN